MNKIGIITPLPSEFLRLKNQVKKQYKEVEIIHVSRADILKENEFSDLIYCDSAKIMSLEI